MSEHSADDPESADALDLTPRDVQAGGAPQRRWWAIALGAVAVVAGGFVLWNGLSQATVFFYNVDEAVARDDLDGRRFRMQGSVVEGSIERSDGGVAFDLSYCGETVAVAHTGEPPELFGTEIPIVVEGEFTGDRRYASDRILVKHDNTYEDENGERIDAASAEFDPERDVESCYEPS